MATQLTVKYWGEAAVIHRSIDLQVRLRRKRSAADSKGRTTVWRMLALCKNCSTPDISAVLYLALRRAGVSRPEIMSVCCSGWIMPETLQQSGM